MDGKFKTILFGFKRNEVVDYIKKLSSEKGQLEEEKLRLLTELENTKFELVNVKSELEIAKNELESLKSAAADNAQRLEASEADLKKAQNLLSESENRLEHAEAESAQFKSRLSTLADAVSYGCSVSDAELLDISSTLSDISLRLKDCLAPVKKSISGSVDTDENASAE